MYKRKLKQKNKKDCCNCFIFNSPNNNQLGKIGSAVKIGCLNCIYDCVIHRDNFLFFLWALRTAENEIVY